MVHKGGGGVKKVQISVHMVYEWPLSMTSFLRIIKDHRNQEIGSWDIVNGWPIWKWDFIPRVLVTNLFILIGLNYGSQLYH